MIKAAKESAKTTVLVTDGEHRAALATVRSLGRAGYDVHVCHTRSHSIAGASRYTTANHNVADPLREPRNFLADVSRVSAAIRADVLLPVTEAALLAVLPHRDQFSCTIPFADAAAFSRICDKREVLETATKHGISIPDQAAIATVADSPRLNGKLHFPVVLKPSRSVAGKEGKRIHTAVSYAADAHGLHDALETIPHAAYPVLLQQRIDGPGFGISVLVWDGQLLAAFAHRRIREKPPSGGVSVLRESIPLDQDLLSRSLALLRDFNWQGVAMVEYKLDAETGTPYLMEINGRLWGSLQLAIDAGVDFPALLVQAALGEHPKPVTTYKSGVRLRWEWGEVDHLLASLFHSRVAVTPTSGARGARQLAAIGDFLRGFGRAQQAEVFRSDDPAPFFRETADWFRRR